jgi:uncharacterized membrane protein YgaE (UPF0421/DUF939 family)
MAWVIVVLGTVKASYNVAWQEISGAVLGIASAIILLTVNSMSHARWLLLVPIAAVLVIDQVLNYRDRHRAKVQPS